MPIPPLEVYLLGLVDFDDAQQLQRRLAYDLGEAGGGALILCEHTPTVSIGRAGSRGHLRVDPKQLEASGIAVRWVNRGGGCVLHLPGQITGYLVYPMARAGLDVGSYVGHLERAIVATLAEFNLAGSPRPEAPGIFLGHSRVASIGVAVSRWIAYHGFTLNVGAYLEPFDAILDEPGWDGYSLRQTSIESRRQRPAPMAQVRESLIRQVETSFGLERHHLYTHHPLVRRKVASHVYAQSAG
jgi:lipoyl(octanoyl) transferase